jgi:hypothetical protein
MLARGHRLRVGQQGIVGYVAGTGEPRIGAHGTPIIFVHPKDMGGVLVELMETPKEGAH